MRRRKKSGPRRPSRKEHQLCAQVREVVNLTLAEASIENLASAWCPEVRPAPSSQRLMVVVEVGPGDDPDEVRALLQRLSGHFRAEVAAAIHRRNTPELFFQVVLPGQPT